MRFTMFIIGIGILLIGVVVIDEVRRMMKGG
jgi:hypothetical protein